MKNLITFEEFVNESTITESKFNKRSLMKDMKKERGIMLLMNKWIYTNEPSSVQWEFNSEDESKINLFKGEEKTPYKTISLQKVIETYPEIALKYNLKTFEQFINESNETEEEVKLNEGKNNSIELGKNKMGGEIWHGALFRNNDKEEYRLSIDIGDSRNFSKGAITIIPYATQVYPERPIWNTVKDVVDTPEYRITVDAEKGIGDKYLNNANIEKYFKKIKRKLANLT